MNTGGPANELELELHLQRVVLRDFTFNLRPLYWWRPMPIGDLPAGQGVDGLELVAVAKDTGLIVSLRFERSEFVNIATAGLQMLDAADAATDTRGGGD